ncbi:MAG: hypothetical protein LBP64_10990 [Tannerella sp.]|nr:hypothetical protein [Tannerella sp.]
MYVNKNVRRQDIRPVIMFKLSATYRFGGKPQSETRTCSNSETGGRQE